MVWIMKLMILTKIKYYLLVFEKKYYILLLLNNGTFSGIRKKTLRKGRTH